MSTVWVSVRSHRARHRLRQIAGDIGTGYGIAATWPPRGEYYEVDAAHAADIRAVKGLHVLKGTPGNGAELFHYVDWS